MSLSARKLDGSQAINELIDHKNPVYKNFLFKQFLKKFKYFSNVLLATVGSQKNHRIIGVSKGLRIMWIIDPHQRSTR
jgi:hypothetical protein